MLSNTKHLLNLFIAIPEPLELWLRQCLRTPILMTCSWSREPLWTQRWTPTGRMSKGWNGKANQSIFVHNKKSMTSVSTLWIGSGRLGSWHLWTVPLSTWVSPPCPCSKWHSIVAGVRVAVGQPVEDRQGRCCGSRGWSQDSLSRSKSARRINWYKHYPTVWQKEYTTSKLRQNYTSFLKKILLVTFRHGR